MNMAASFPISRRQQVDWLREHRGALFIVGFEVKTDQEVKRIFEREFFKFKSAADIFVETGEIAHELCL